jgi:hypothetical protein
MQEVASASSIKYGNGTTKNSKFCAEFMSYKDEIILFLWIPYKMGESPRIGRARIWTDWQDRALIEGYVSQGVGTEINKTKRRVQKIIDAIDEGGYHFRFTIKSYDRLGSPISVRLPVKDSVGKKYIQEINIIIRNSKLRKTLVCEEIELILSHEKLCEQAREKASMSPEYKTLPSEVAGYDRSLESLLDLALEKWSDRV